MHNFHESNLRVAGSYDTAAPKTVVARFVEMICMLCSLDRSGQGSAGVDDRFFLRARFDDTAPSNGFSCQRLRADRALFMRTQRTSQLTGYRGVMDRDDAARSKVADRD